MRLPRRTQIDRRINGGRDRHGVKRGRRTLQEHALCIRTDTMGRMFDPHFHFRDALVRTAGAALGVIVSVLVRVLGFRFTACD